MKLTNPELIVKRSYKEVYKDGDKIVKIFEKDHPKSAVFNEALTTVRVEEAGLDIPCLLYTSYRHAAFLKVYLIRSPKPKHIFSPLCNCFNIDQVFYTYIFRYGVSSPGTATKCQ